MDELEQIVNQAETEKAEEKEESFQLATVGEITANGIKLIFDGADGVSDKEYKCNISATFKAGDRVKITKESGSYIVDFPIGVPNARSPFPPGGEEGDLLSRGSEENSLIWLSESTFVKLPSGGSSGKVLGYSTDDGAVWVNGLPASGGTTGQLLRKTATGTEWATVIPTSGTTGQFLRKTASGTEWADSSASFPTGGTTGQFLQKTATGTAWASAATFPTGGTAGQMLKKTATGTEWATVSTYSGPTINGTGTTSLAFFGGVATQKKTVAKASTSATLAQTITVVNNLLTALGNYGLISTY